MNLFKHIPVIAIIAMLALIVGCSGGSTPLTPNPNDTLDNVPIIGLTEVEGMYTMIGMLGAYEVNVDFDNQTADLVSKRNAAVGEGYIVSGLSFFTMAPCSNCLQLVGLDVIPGESLSLGFSIQHPFAPGNPANPPTAANRLDLDVFDVAAVIVPADATETTYPLTGSSIYDNLCANPHGYTKELANVISNNNALPYFLVIDNDADGTSTWNKLGMGASAEFDIDFSLLSGGFSFDMYLTMGYGASARKMQRLTPKYFNPEFNRTAAWKVEVVPPGPAEMGSTWQDNDDTTEYGVEIHVWDWQQGATVYGDPADFENAPIDNIFSASDVASVSVEIIGMTSTLPTVSDPDSGTGMPGDPLVFIVPITNENLLAPGQYAGLVKVTDERPAGVWTVDGRDFIIDTPDGIALNNYNLPEYATYQTFLADVVQGCGPLELISFSGCPTGDIDNGTIVNFALTADSPLGGMPVTFEIDTDYNGSTFNPDPLYPANTTGIFNVLFYDDPCVEGTSYDIAFRLTDSCDPSNALLLDDLCTVTIGMCCPEVVVDSVVPDWVGIWDPHTVEIQGSGFVDGPDLEVRWIPESPYSDWCTEHVSTSVEVVDSNTIRASFGSIYDRDCWYVYFYYHVKVTNGCGLSDQLDQALYMDF